MWASPVTQVVTDLGWMLLYGWDKFTGNGLHAFITPGRRNRDRERFHHTGGGLHAFITPGRRSRKGRGFVTQGVVCMLSSHQGDKAEIGRARQTQVNPRWSRDGES